MADNAFKVSNSITRRLTAIMFSILAFIIVTSFFVYISSVSFIEGIQEINSANILLNFTNQSIEGLQTSNSNLDKITNNTKVSDVEFAFNENQKILVDSLNKAMKVSKDHHEVHALLQKSYESVFQYENSSRELFKKAKAKTSSTEIKSEILIANQFAMDAIEYLRKSQIVLRKNSNKIFSTIYKNRFKPLKVALTISTLFLLFIITFGLPVARRIVRSIEALKNATAKVSTGEYTFQLPVLSRDEFGLLTHTFNDMLKSIQEGRDALGETLGRIQTLQRITARYSESLTMDEVITFTIHEGMSLLKAQTGTVALLTDSENEIELKKWEGYSLDIAQPWAKYSINTRTPLSDVAREKDPLFIESEAQLSKLYPHIPDFKKTSTQSLACVPLIIGKQCYGTLAFSFDHEIKFTNEDREFLMAFGQQCSQAIHRSKLYDDSKKAIKARDEFLSIASHELKTPLTPLKLQLQLLARQLKMSPQKITEEKVNKALDNSDQQLNRITKLVEDLLDVSRITSGKLKLNFEKANFSQMINEVLQQYGPHLKANLGKVHVELDDEIEGLCDPLRVEQVLINILTNATKYAPGKPIEVKLKKVNNKAVISIKDQGPGVSKENQERIFGRFERVSDSENIGGLGLGLYISKQIIQAHNGVIYIESELGLGSKFVIELPLS